MDDTQSMTPALEGAADRPLVTFALFAYNQEKYIREAVEGAFSQTYEPLEIILSDDCSTDRTFEIMQEMASAYNGPHRVKVRCNAFNLGTALHVQSAFAESAGALFVVAAGDDISLPHRVAALVAAWEANGCPPGVVHSGRETFRDGSGETARRHPPKRNASPDVLEGYARSYWLPAAAPTCAYTREVFERFPPLLGGGVIEDAPLLLRAALVGRFIACERVLVRQRIHGQNNGTGYRIGSAARWNRFMQSKIIAFRTMQIDLRSWRDGLDPLLRERIETRILSVIRSAAGLIVVEGRTPSSAQNVVFFLRMLLAPAVARTFAERARYLLDFTGLTFHVRLKSLFRTAFLS